MTAAVQDRLELASIEDGIGLFGTGDLARSVAILDVVGADTSLATADDATQEEILAGRAQFLNAQMAPFQIVVRAEQVDLEGHLRRVRDRAALLHEPLASVARDHAAFVQGLGHHRVLLDRHCYIVLPDKEPTPAATLGRRLRRLLGRGGSGREESEAVSAEVGRRLRFRCDQVSRQLGRSGLHTHRLSSQQFAELFHRCWSPELARVQRLKDELGAYTTLVVGSTRTATQTRTDTDTDVDVDAASEQTPDEDLQLLALGARTLADLIAPSSVEIKRDHLLLDAHYARVLAVTAYPRLVSPGWLSALVESDLPLELSLHVRPLASGEMVRALSVQIARLESSRLAAVRGQRVADPEREIALEDAERLRQRLQRGDERLFSVSLYVLLRSSTLHELEDLTRRVEAQLDALLAHSRRALWEQEQGFFSCVPQAQDGLLVPRNLDTSALAATIPFVGPSLAMEGGMLVGVARGAQAPVLLDPFDRSLDNANQVVVAPAGAGKSFFCKLLALRQLINGTSCIVVDPEDEYRPLAEAVGGQIVRLAASSAHRLNPFDLVPSPVPSPVAPPFTEGSSNAPAEEDPLAERVTALLGLLEVMLCGPDAARGRTGGLDSHERAVLDRALFRTYAAAGITSDLTTHTRPAPVLKDLATALAEMPGEVASSLASRLARFIDGSLSTGLFAGPTNVELDRPFVVFQIRDLAEELRPLAIHLIASWVWTRIRRDRRPRLLIVDEAWSLLRFPEGGAFLAAMARRARKHYLGLVTITQQVSDLGDGGHGESILANAAQVLLLKQKAETIEAATTRFRLTSDERQLLLGADKGEGLLLVRGNRIPLQVVASPTEYRLATTSPRDLEQLALESRKAPAPPRPARRALKPDDLGALLGARRDTGANRRVQNGVTYESPS
jgi:hypothetical protein